MRNFLSVIALALMGAVMTGCSSDDSLSSEPQQPAVKDNIVTVTTTIGLGGGDATTRALSATGVKTFEVGDQIALFYEKSGSSDQFKAVATASNISANGKSATFTFELDNPKSNSDIALSYPASFMNAIPNDFYPAFAQDGTLNVGVKANDLGYATGNLVGTDLPASISLTNRFAVVAFTLKDGKGTAEKGDDEEITGDITEMTINLPDHENQTYTITRDAAAGPIYVVLPPISSGETINITATGGGKTYTKTLDNKTYAASNFYQQGLLMTKQAASAPEGAINGKFSVSATKQVYFSKGNLRYVSGTWSFFDNQYGCYNTYNANTWDKFGWSTSATTYGMSTSTDYGDYSGDFVDWGNVSGIGSGWYTLSISEWGYLFNTRSASTVNSVADARYAKGRVNGVNGIILFPDTYTHPAGVTLPVGINEVGNAGWNGNNYSAADWTAMETNGAVFLPAAGYRGGNEVDLVGSFGGYWSSSAYNSSSAYYMGFRSDVLNAVNDNASMLSDGQSVRLVCNAN